MKTRKSLLCFALASGVLVLSLTGCGESSYENFEECQLKEVHKLSRDSKELSNQALNVIIDFCAKYPTRSEQNANDLPAKNISVPKWTTVGPEKGYVGGSRFFIDTNNIETDQSEITFWYKQLDKGQTVQGYDDTLFRIKMDCSYRNMDIISVEKTVNGTTGVGREGPWYDVTITPGTNWADAYKYVCEKNK